MLNMPSGKILVELQNLLSASRVHTDELTLGIYARDASLYRIVPQVVIEVENEGEMSKVLALAYANDCPVGFRAAGTSLSGQALTSGILILQGQGWRDMEVMNGGELVRLGPGCRGSEVNARLKPYGRKIGPDPASMDAAKIGGIAANNASGMCCGTQHNTYQTMKSCRLIFSDGYLLDTSSEESRQSFRESHPEVLARMEALADNLRCRPDWVEMIRHKYLLKNTTGYSINSFLDYSDPIDIIAHLMVGSEGTLGYISEITYRTVPEYANKSNALVFFKDLHQACLAVQKLSHIEVNAVELMDNKALRSVSEQIHDHQIAGDQTTALLIEVQAASEATLKGLQASVRYALQEFEVSIKFTDDPMTYAHHWKIRKGMFPSVAAMRAKEETVIIEDIAIPMDQLAEGTLAIQQLFLEAGYTNAIIFGHALAGNLHIVFTLAFGSESNKLQYQNLMDRLSDLVVGTYGGSLKAEHGTGRNMAPYVKKEWGAGLYELMKSLKEILDPKAILNPGVVISDDEAIHLKNLKPMPSVHDGIDACMECGFCERVCPSRELSLTPRARIMALREMKIKGQTLQHFAQRQINGQMQYSVLDTCAADGMCAEACPVKINTGKMVKILREMQHPPWKKFIALRVARNQRTIEGLARLGLKAFHGSGKVLGPGRWRGVVNGLHRWSRRATPSIQGPLPLPARTEDLAQALRENSLLSKVKCIVIYQSCINRIFGQREGQATLPDVTTSLVALASKVGYRVIMEANSGECCGLPYASKGFGSTAYAKLQSSLRVLEQLTEGGRWPVVVDNSPCSQELKVVKTHLKIFDAVEWLDKTALSEIQIQRSSSPLWLHTTCSARKMGLHAANLRIAEALSTKVIEPEGIECCGFAGDRGFSHPELNRSALKSLPKALTAQSEGGASSSTTCGLGLEWNSGRPYPHLVQILDAASVKKNSC